MNDHTPAPWTMIRHDAYDISYIIRGGKDQNQIAQIYNWQDISRDVSSKANARLIAAAPEMLDMLKKCLEALEYVGPWETPVGLIEQVQKMIDKAEGNDAAK